MARVKFTWHGAIIARKIDAATDAGLGSVARAAQSLLRSELHRWTGEMAARSFAEVSSSGGRRTLSIGSDAEHTFFHEVAPNNYPPHPQIRPIADRIGPTIIPAIRGAMGRI